MHIACYRKDKKSETKRTEQFDEENNLHDLFKGNKRNQNPKFQLQVFNAHYFNRQFFY